DFRALPEPDGMFDVVAFDPPYVCPGGRKTSTIRAMHDAYGMNGDEFRTPAELQTIIDAGLKEMLRVVKPRGIVLVKCKSYRWSGKFWAGTYKTMSTALGLGFEQVSEFIHVGVPGPQSQVTQLHPRNNSSTLLVLRAPRGRR